MSGNIVNKNQIPNLNLKFKHQNLIIINILIIKRNIDVETITKLYDEIESTTNISLQSDRYKLMNLLFDSHALGI